MKAALNNCTQVSDTVECKGLQGACDACDTACMEQSIQDIKDEIVPASFFVLFLKHNLKQTDKIYEKNYKQPIQIDVNL